MAHELNKPQVLGKLVGVINRKFGLNGYKRAPDNTGQWFDGCDRDVILFDDVEANAIPPFSKWKQLCDRYPHSVPVKGGFILWKPKTQTPN